MKTIKILSLMLMISSSAYAQEKVEAKTARANSKDAKALQSVGAVKDVKKSSAKPANTTTSMGGQEGNGGAGVSRLGRYMTFYSAGLYTKTNRETIPEIEKLIEFISSMTYLTGQTRGDLIAALTPNDSREYLQVTNFDKKTKDRLLAEFHRVTGVEGSDLELFAVTDTNSKKTFLLPSFYELSEQDKMAILFHEAFWILHPKYTYAQVVAAEVSFQAALDRPTQLERQMELVSIAGSPADSLKLALNHDLSTGALGNLVKNGVISADDLFGPDYYACGGSENCWSSSLDYLYTLSKELPYSLLIKKLIRSVSSKKIEVLVGRHEECRISDKNGSSRSSSGMRITSFNTIMKCTIDTKSVTVSSDSKGALKLNCAERVPVRGCEYEYTGSISF
jgi:hypothetical protein